MEGEKKKGKIFFSTVDTALAGERLMALILDKLYLAFIEFLASFLGSGPILTGCHMALQCAVPCKMLMAIWTLVRLFTYR